MQSPNEENTSTLHRRLGLRRTWPNRIFALIYTSTIIALLYQHTTTLIHHATTIHVLMLLADIVLAVMWFTQQGFRMNPVHRKTFPENLPKDEKKYPAIDVFICTADPYKEPPMVAMNTALSVLAYDYPTEKMSVFISDDGGSKLTLFAFTEAAKFAKRWLPYCKNNGIMDRSPEAYFNNSHSTDCFSDTNEIKSMYEKMKFKIEESVANGNVYPDEKWAHMFSRWDAKFKRADHPTVIQVLLDNAIDGDILGHMMPNLIYVSREKRTTTPHRFKAGALNVLLRVSEIMTNAPIILTLDCDMYSNNPKTPLDALCYFLDPSKDSNDIAYVQYPQLFHGIDQDDLYGAEFKFIFQINMAGFDGLLGPSHVGTGCFFRRRAFYGGPSSQTSKQTSIQSIQSDDVLARAHEVARSDFEEGTKWGNELGYRYGSLVEDFYTGYLLQCQGWKSAFRSPNQPAFLGNAPMNLYDLINQTQRWSIGVLDMAFSEHNPFNHGLKALPFLHNICYIHYALWPIWCIPIVIYSILPQLALIRFFPIFPKVSNIWFSLYAFSFIGAYFQNFLDIKLSGGTTRGWYNNQRAWIIRCLSSNLFGLLEFTLTKLHISNSTFNVTSKVIDEEANTRYMKGMMEFGVESAFYYPISIAALVNMVALVYGIMQILKHGGFEDLFVQLFLSGFGVVNSWPVYEAMFFRSDSGRMPLKITLRSIVFTYALYLASSMLF